MVNKKTFIVCSFIGLLTVAVLFLLPQQEAKSELVTEPPANLTVSSEENPLSFSPILAWDKDNEAICYEIEFFAQKPAHISNTRISNQAIYRSRQIYQNHYNPPLANFAAEYLGKQPLYWRVRGIDFNGTPYTPFSALQELWTSSDAALVNAPVILSSFGGSNGSVLLYPVYHWIPLSSAKSYEIALYAVNPEQVSSEPVAVLTSTTAEYYDPQPRISNTGFYWRVRGLDEAGNPCTEWSKTGYFRNAPADDWQVAVLGDSISHGGGHFSYGPEDFEFSWLNYLDFPTINLSESGDTAQMTLDRFERDVLPFHPQYLLIMTGSNSLRAGEDPMHVIDCLQQIQQKCYSAGIRPILLTLPAINPANINHVFNEETADDWQERFSIVNTFIRSQVHIDTAAAFSCPDGILPTPYALDGLHPDANGKRLMGEKINSVWQNVCVKADNAFERQKR